MGIVFAYARMRRRQSGRCRTKLLDTGNMAWNLRSLSGEADRELPKIDMVRLARVGSEAGMVNVRIARYAMRRIRGVTKVAIAVILRWHGLVPVGKPS